MALLGSLQVRLGLDASTFSQGFNTFQRGLEKRVRGFQRSMSGLTNIGSLLGAGSLTAGLSNAVTDAGNFQQSLSQVAAASGATGIQIKALSDLALQMGKTTVFGANAAAAAMLDLAKAGLDPAQIAGGALTATMQLAATEGMELSRAAQVMAEQMGAFGLSAADAASIADSLAGASIASTASVDGLAQGLSQVAAVANLSGLTLQQTSGALALLAQNGIKGSDAGTSLKTMLLRLVPSSKEAADEMEKLGISFTDSQGKIKDITQISEILQTRLRGLTQAQRTSSLQTIFGTDAYRAAAVLTKSGAAGLRDYILATNDKTAAERLSEARTTGVNGALAKFRNAIETAGISLLQGGFLDGLATLATRGADLLGRASDLPAWVKNFGIGLTLAAASAPALAFGLTTIAGVIPILTKGLGLAATFLLGPWGLALTGAALAAFAFKDQILAEFTAIQTGLQNYRANNTTELTALSQEWAEFSGIIGTYAAPIIDWITAIDTAGMTNADAMQARANARAKFWEDYLGGLTIIGTNTLAWFNEAIPAIELVLGEWLNKFRTWIDEQLAAGDRLRAGFANFFGGIRDTVTTIGATITGVLDSITSKINAVTGSIGSVGTSLQTLATKGNAHLTALTSGIGKAAGALTNFGKVGKKETDRAVGNSWLTDLTDLGQKHFQALITNGIDPASTALQTFGKNGQLLAPTFTPGSAGGDPTAAFQGLSLYPAQDFESAWSISLRNTQQALDQFIHTGEISVKGLVRTMIAEFASAQLRKAIQSLWEGVGKIFTGGGTTSGGGSIWGSLGNLAGSVFKAFGSFEGGGYTGSGPRTGGMDGRGGRLALLHPQETVIDHTRIHATATKRKTPQVNLTVPITLQPGVSREELSRILPQVQQNIIQIIPDLIARGGSYASAFGQ